MNCLALQCNRAITFKNPYNTTQFSIKDLERIAFHKRNLILNNKIYRNREQRQCEFMLSKIYLRLPQGFYTGGHYTKYKFSQYTNYVFYSCEIVYPTLLQSKGMKIIYIKMNSLIIISSFCSLKFSVMDTLEYAYRGSVKAIHVMYQVME